MHQPASRSLLADFAALEDPRRAAKLLYPLPQILLLLSATLAGADDFVEVEFWGKEQLAFLRRFLPWRHGGPGHDTSTEVPGQAKRRAMPGATDPVRRQLLVHISASKRSTDFVDLLDDLGPARGIRGRPKPLVIVMDNGPIHTSKITKALAERPWLTVKCSPKHALEMSQIERRWRNLKRHHLANRTVVDGDDLDRTIHRARDRLNLERQPPSSSPFLKAAQTLSH